MPSSGITTSHYIKTHSRKKFLLPWVRLQAAQDLYNRIKKISYSLPKDDNFLLTIALDGENPWERYENNGKDFLAKRDFPVLLSLEPGSWAQGNFDTWFRSQENQKAWEKLTELRRILQVKTLRRFIFLREVIGSGGL